MTRYPQEDIKPYDGEGKKSLLVEKMFDNIAEHYDRLNHTLSLGIDKSWRRKAIKQLEPHHPEKILDIATGTGDFALLAQRMLRPKSIIGADLSEEMMNVGRKKVNKAGLSDTISFQKEDCTSLSFNDETFDAITIAFGIRNFDGLDNALLELHRVLKENGHLVILELSEPQHFPMKQLYAIYSKIFIPFIGKVISKDSSAYTYLPQTIKAFPQGEIMQKIIAKAGFKEVTYQHLTFGICTLYKATK